MNDVVSPEDFQCCREGPLERLFGEACGDGESRCGGVSAAGESCGERSSLMFMAQAGKGSGRPSLDYIENYGNGCSAWLLTIARMTLTTACSLYEGKLSGTAQDSSEVE